MKWEINSDEKKKQKKKTWKTQNIWIKNNTFFFLIWNYKLFDEFIPHLVWIINYYHSFENHFTSGKKENKMPGGFFGFKNIFLSLLFAMNVLQIFLFSSS